MKNKKRILVIVGIVVVALIAFLLIGLRGSNKNESISTEEAQDLGKETTITKLIKKAFDGDEDENDEDDSKDEDSAEDSGSSSGKDSGSSSSSRETSSKDAEEKSIFPYKIAGTSLVIDYIDAYDGIFMEDGSDKSVKNIGAMVVTNKGNSNIEYARLTVKTDKGNMNFAISALPSGESVVVQESSAAKYTSDKINNVQCEIASLDEFEMSKNQVSVNENTDGSLKVTNLTDKDIPGVRVFYKFYMEDEDIYVGGITYNSKVTNLKAGESCNVTPSHYAAGSSKIVMVRTYDTAE